MKQEERVQQNPGCFHWSAVTYWRRKSTISL
jgi:hypothetical protein